MIATESFQKIGRATPESNACGLEGADTPGLTLYAAHRIVQQCTVLYQFCVAGVAKVNFRISLMLPSEGKKSVLFLHERFSRRTSAEFLPGKT